jgi:hypothetical protein
MPKSEPERAKNTQNVFDESGRNVLEGCYKVAKRNGESLENVLKHF